MISDFFAIAARSRRHLAQDAIGVCGLFVLLIGSLHFAAV
ncbi:hypothetical protein SAMN05421774_101120 [Gemmobacter megaterium]|uniref:Uncharacterized protein n=1 Tax=Gemmobacter megaterium TaxID=1086013 RepID=A0A1N7JYP6_9RHOB|nr:hypothetical protein SAMN05421774_101120 [Gemmobacter megaterium]